MARSGIHPTERDAASTPIDTHGTGLGLSLVGLPGAGKSTLGRSLARALKLPFRDSDDVIEQRIGCTIALYFEHRGESAFRDVEEQVLDELCAGPPQVLATGGGAVLRPANRKRLRACSRVVYLHASPESVHLRVRNDKRRPLLQVADPLGRLRELYCGRDHLYREVAHVVVPTEDCRSLRDLRSRVLAGLNDTVHG